MKNSLRILSITRWTMIVLILIQLALSSCGHKLQQLIDAQNNNEYVYFEYMDSKHIKVTALKAVWFTDNYPAGDTILLNTHEFVLVKLPDDEYNISVGNGNDDVMSFTF